MAVLAPGPEWQLLIRVCSLLASTDAARRCFELPGVCASSPAFAAVVGYILMHGSRRFIQQQAHAESHSLVDGLTLRMDPSRLYTARSLMRCCQTSLCHSAATAYAKRLYEQWQKLARIT